MVLSRFDLDYWSSQQLYDKHFDWLLFITYWRKEVWMTSPFTTISIIVYETTRFHVAVRLLRKTY